MPWCFEKKLTEPTDFKGYHSKASKDDPEYLVKSDKTGAEAAHKPEALKKLSASEHGASKGGSKQ